MGVVHRAFDPGTQRQVALKVLLAGSADRFEREGVLSARLDHPNIVRVHASGVREGRPCLVYELVEGGRTLHDAMATGCSLEEGVRLLRDAARGLGHAHARGVIHRDVKPENVLIDSVGRAKVADFGLAASKGLDQLTVTGTVLGTPLYMAPETLGGIKEQVGPPTDVWALGAILYELLAGTPPFSGESLVTLSVQVVEASIPPIDSSREVPPALLAVAKRALQKAPEDRYPDADALAQDLDAYLRGELQAPSGGGRWPLVLAILVALAVVAAVAGAIAARDQSATRSPAPDSPLPTATPSPTATATPLAPLSGVLKIADPLERYLAIRRWLEAAPADHPERRLAQRGLRRLLPKPLRSGEVGGDQERVVAAFAPGGRILAAGQRGGLVSAWEGTKRIWITQPSPKRLRGGTLGLAKGRALWWTTKPLWLRPYGPAGPKARPRKLGPHAARLVAASPNSKRLAVACLGPNRVLIVDWPQGDIRHEVPLPSDPHSLMFDRKGRIWIGVGLSMADSFTTNDGQVIVIGAARGRVLRRCEIRAGSAPHSLALDPLSGETLLGLSSGDLMRLSPQAEKLGSVPAFKEGDVLTRTFRAGLKVQVFDRAGERYWVAINSLETESYLAEIDWKAKRLVREMPVSEETETLVLSRDETLLLRGNRSGRWELWGSGQ